MTKMREILYIHYKNNNLYRILNTCKYQHNNEWYDAVCYQNVKNFKVYVREEENFEKLFKIIEDE